MFRPKQSDRIYMMNRIGVERIGHDLYDRPASGSCACFSLLVNPVNPVQIFRHQKLKTGLTRFTGWVLQTEPRHKIEHSRSLDPAKVLGDL